MRTLRLTGLVLNHIELSLSLVTNCFLILFFKSNDNDQLNQNYYTFISFKSFRNWYNLFGM